MKKTRLIPVSIAFFIPFILHYRGAISQTTHRHILPSKTYLNHNFPLCFLRLAQGKGLFNVSEGELIAYHLMDKKRPMTFGCSAALDALMGSLTATSRPPSLRVCQDRAWVGPPTVSSTTSKSRSTSSKAVVR